MRGTRILLGVVCLAVGLLPAPSLHAAPPLGGLAVAVSPDGQRLVAGGDTRALYVLDPESLSVTRRVHLGRAVVALAFTPDGKHLIAESTKAVQWLNSDGFEVVATVERAERMAPAPAAGRVAFLDKGATSIRVLSMDDGSEVAVVPHERRSSVAAFGLSGDGEKLGLLYYKKRDEAEEKVAYKDIPKDLKGAALNEFKQRHDGMTARFQVFDVATGESVLEKTLWYAAPGGGNRLFAVGPDFCVVSYENQNARIDAEGNATYFELGNGYNYAMAGSADGAVLLTGGLRDGSRTSTAGLEGTPFRLDELPGFPEYFKSFSLASDGAGFAGTSAFRVVRIDAAGKIQKAEPVF